MKLIPTIAVLLTMTLLLTPCAGIAESLPLTEEQVAFYRARTEEWEAAYGPCVVWDYQTRAAFSKIYHRFPGDYINRMDPDHPALPVLPENVAVSYEASAPAPPAGWAAGCTGALRWPWRGRSSTPDSSG